MAKNVSKASLGRPLPDAKRPRNPFDRSFSVNFNTKNGFLDPVFSEYVPAGSHVEINRSEFCRMADINTAAMVGFDHFIDFFAVPIKLLWTDWDNWYLNIRDEHSSQFTDISNPPSTVFALPGQRNNVFALSLTSILNYSDALSGLYPGTGEVAYSMATYDGIRKWNSRRLLNRLKYGIVPAWGASSQWANIIDSFNYAHDSSNQFQNLFRLLAYQKVYYDHYRNTAYETQNPFLFNIDWIKDGVTPTASQLQALCAGITNLHGVNYRKDFYQSIFPALNYIPAEGSVVDGFTVPSNVGNLLGILQADTGDDLGRWKNMDQPKGLAGVGTSQSGSVAQSQSGSWVNVSHTHIFEQSLGPNAYNVQAIRAAFALDKMKRQSAYAPRHIKDQYAARFGFNYSSAEEGHCVRIGSFKSGVLPSEVIQTTPTSGSPLGTIGGKGVSGDNYSKTIKYDAKDGDCLIMGISYFMPRLMYDSSALDPFNVKFFRNDFFMPEFENLGLQPIYNKFYRLADNSTPTLNDAENNALRGWQTRYQEYKTGISQNFGLFVRGQQLSIFTSAFDMSDRLALNPSGLSWQFFKVRPQDVDNLFVTAADATELTDQFYGFINFDFKANQNMSIHGQPKL